MNIIKHGEQASDNLMTEEFECGQCGCKFTADYDEYYVENGSSFTTSSSLTYTYLTTIIDKYVCSCPECHKIVVKTKQRLNENPTITLTKTDSITLSGTDSKENIPNYCKNCSNHPSNGGSGNCNCTLGSMGQVTCQS